METRQYNVYKFDELSDKAKEKAIEKYRENNLDYEWWDFAYESFIEDGKEMGFEFHNRTKNNPKAVNQPKIYFSGFYSQGDGLCYDADIDLKVLTEKQPFISQFTAKQLEQIKKMMRQDILESVAVVKGNERYYNIKVETFWNKIPADCCKKFNELINKIDEVIQEIASSFQHEMYIELRDEYEHLNSDECITETLKANDYMFTENGTID